MQYTLTTPCTAQDLAPLRAGDTVLLSGVVYTARDQAHKRMIEALDGANRFPSILRAALSTTSAPPRSARVRSSALPAPPPAAGWMP